MIFEPRFITGVACIWRRELIQLSAWLFQQARTAVFKGFNKLLSHLIALRLLHYVDYGVVVKLYECHYNCRKTGDIRYKNCRQTENALVFGNALLHGLAVHHQLPENNTEDYKSQSRP